VLVVSTAHWAKFGADVFKALNSIGDKEPLPAFAESMSGVQLLLEVAGMAPGAASVPQGLAGLDEMPERFSTVVGPGRDEVEGAVESWLAQS